MLKKRNPGAVPHFNVHHHFLKLCFFLLYLYPNSQYLQIEITSYEAHSRSKCDTPKEAKLFTSLGSC